MRRGDIGPDDNASAIHSQLMACGAGFDRRGWLRARIAIDSDCVECAAAAAGRFACR